MDINNINFRNLAKHEIEVRIGTCSEKGVSLLLYKDARCDMKLLDEAVGAMNWQKSYQLIDGQLFCTISIWDESKQQWIGKQDVGTESNTEAEKGRASDAAKRASFCWGAGRSLYSAPFIWFSANECNISGQASKKCNDKFSVTEIQYDDNGDISSVRILNHKTDVEKLFKNVKAESKVQLSTKEQDATMRKLIAKHGKREADILEMFGVKSFEGLSVQKFNEIAKFVMG